MLPPRRPTPTRTETDPPGYPEIVHLDLANVWLRLRLALKARSPLPWLVTAGAGLGAGRLTIASPPERRLPDGTMTPADRMALAALLGTAALLTPHGVVIPDTTDHYVEYIDRAEGRAPRIVAQTMDWDLEEGTCRP